MKTLGMLLLTAVLAIGLLRAADWTGPNDGGEFLHPGSGRHATGIYLQPCVDFKTTKIAPSLTPAAVTLANGEVTFYDDITLTNNGTASDLRYRKVPDQADPLPADWLTNFSRIKMNGAPFTFRATGYEKIFFWTNVAETDASSMEECWPGSLGTAFASTYTSTKTHTNTSTPTSTPTWSPTASPTITMTRTISQSHTFSPTITLTATPSATPSQTKTATGTATPTGSPTQTPTHTATPFTAALKIVEIYAGGGASGAPYENDYAVIFNSSGSSASLSGMSIQKGTTGLSFVSKANLSGSVAANAYYLVKMASSGSVGDPLPTEDLDGSGISLSNGTGYLALVNSTSLATCGDSTIVDLVGWGTAGCKETTAAASIAGNGSSLQRLNDCTDTGDNSADFSSSTPQPRNSSSASNDCP